MMKHIEIETVVVRVGDLDLKLRTPALSRQGEIAKALAKLDLGPFLGAVQNLVLRSENFLAGIAVHGEALYHEGVKLLGVAAGEVLTDLLGAALDTEANFMVLKAAGAAGDADVERDDRGRYRTCPRLRSYIGEEATPGQGLAIAEEIIRLGGYSSALGKLLRPLVERAENLAKTPSQVVVPPTAEAQA